MDHPIAFPLPHIVIRANIATPFQLFRDSLRDLFRHVPKCSWIAWDAAIAFPMGCFLGGASGPPGRW
eukprot:11458609-Alexandrium_andersonii.AAC.1